MSPRRFLSWFLVFGLASVAFAQPERPYFKLYQLGRTQLLRGEPDEARDSFNQSLARAPRFGPALLGRARASLWLGEPEPALADLEASSGLPATGRVASLLLAEVLIYLNRHEEARTALQGLGEEPASRLLLLSLETSDRVLKIELGRHLDVPEGFLALGARALRAGSAERAEPLLKIAAAMDGENPMPQLFLPGLETERDRYYVPARLAGIQEAEKRGDRWTAMKEYRQLLEWMPGLPVLLVRTAWQALAMGATELAERLALEAVESLPDDATVHFLLASVRAETDRTDEAVASCRKAIELGLREARVYLTLGDLLQEKMQVQEALTAYAEALRLDPAIAERIPSFSLSALLTAEGDEVRTRLQGYVESHPESPEILYALGTTSLRDGELEKARGYFQEMARVAPERSQAFYNLGLVHLRLGEEAASRDALERFRELKAREDDEFERHNRAHFRRLEAQEAAVEGRTDQAVEIYAGLIGEGLGEGADFLALGRLWRQAGDPAKAFASFEKALELLPYEKEALSGLADAARAAGRDDVAQRCRERLAVLSP